MHTSDTLRKASRAIGINYKGLAGYVHLTPGYTDDWRVRYRIPKYLPGYTRRDICIGHYPTEELAVFALDIFLANYCLEYPEVVSDIKWMFATCAPNSLQEIVESFSIVLGPPDVRLQCNDDYVINM